MAVAVIGGLNTATFMSLLVIPAVFTYIDILNHCLPRLWRRLQGRKGKDLIADSKA